VKKHFIDTLPEYQQFEAHVKFVQAKHGSIRTDWDVGTLVILLAQLQLALRHPHNRGYGSKVTRQYLDDVIIALDNSSPGFGALLRKGDNPDFDVPAALVIGPATDKKTSWASEIDGKTPNDQAGKGGEG
jgi:hypothetical protein